MYHLRHLCLMNVVRPKTEDAIIEAAFAVFAESPAASLGDVAARAGVGRATLHRYFPGRNELLRALAKVASSEIDTAIEKATADATSCEEELRLTLFAIVPLATRQWFIANAGIDADPEVAALHKRNREIFCAEIETAKEAGLFDPHTPTVWIAEAYENLVFAAWALVQSGEATPKQAANLAWNTFATGLIGGNREY